MRGLWEGAFVVAALASSECYADHRPRESGRLASHPADQWRQQHDDADAHTSIRVMRPVLPAIRLTIR
jgi:hypothetical protein